MPSNEGGREVTGPSEVDIDSWLVRFVTAQQEDFERALAEVSRGKKVSHWMWFIFPQVPRPQTSEASRHFAVPSIGHAVAFLRHQVLGENFHAITSASRASLEASRGSNRVRGIFGSPDDRKFVSSMTLMAEAAERAGMTDLADECRRCLAIAYEDGMQPCQLTNQLIGSQQ